MATGAGFPAWPGLDGVEAAHHVEQHVVGSVLRAVEVAERVLPGSGGQSALCVCVCVCGMMCVCVCDVCVI